MTRIDDARWEHDKFNPDGVPPRFVRPDDPITILLNGPCAVPGPAEEGSLAKRVSDDDQWRKACGAHRRGGRPWVVKEKKLPVHRTWKLDPRLSDDGLRCVVLTPLFELDDGYGSLKTFCGQSATVVEPLVMARGMRPLVKYISSAEEFDRVTAPVGAEIGWGSASREIALFSNYGLVRPTGRRQFYGPDHETVQELSSDKDREHAPGNKIVYRRDPSWESSFLPQWEEFLASKGEKTRPYEPPPVGSLSAAVA